MVIMSGLLAPGDGMAKGVQTCLLLLYGGIYTQRSKLYLLLQRNALDPIYPRRTLKEGLDP